MLAKNSFRYIFPPLLISVVVFYLHSTISLIIFGFTLYLVWFFRDPPRTILFNENVLYGVADGKIVEIVEGINELKIATRMSPFNVHINRSPISGVVTKIQHKPGKHSSVYFAGAEQKNEQNLIVIENSEIYVEILQITGAFARRIETWIDEGDEISQGQKIGIIRFGSQTNLLIRLKESDKSIKVNVSIGHAVKAGLTNLASLHD